MLGTPAERVPSGLAAHVAAQGIEVALLDLPAPTGDRSALAKKGLGALRKLKPSPLHLPEHASAIRPGNFEDDGIGQSPSRGNAWRD